LQITLEQEKDIQRTDKKYNAFAVFQVENVIVILHQKNPEKASCSNLVIARRHIEEYGSVN
jgi:hypothetical protein